MDTLSKQFDDDDWRKDTQSYLFDLMNDQELFKRTMSFKHPPSHYQQENTSAANIISINNGYELSFREQYFQDACREIIQYQNRHGIRITCYKDPPEWIIQQTSNDNGSNHNSIITPFISNCIKEEQNKGGTWQTDKVTDDHLSNLEKQWNKSIPWKKYNRQDLEFAQSLYMLELPLMTLSTYNQRVLPLWTLQNRTRMLPIMKVPHIIDDSKSSIQDKQTDHFSMIEEQRQISIDQTVFDELNQLILDPFDNKCTTTKNSNNLSRVNNDVIWSSFPKFALFDKESFLQSWISYPSKNNLSSVSTNNNTTKDKSNNINIDNNNIISMEDSHTLESSTTYSNLDYDSMLMESIVGNNDEKKNHEHDFTNRERNNITTTNSLPSSQSDMGNKRALPTAVELMPKYSQQQNDHNKQHSTIMIGTREEEKESHDVVNLEPSMYVDALAGIRRVNEYAGKRRKLDGLTSEDAFTVHNKRRKEDSVSSVDYYNTNSSRASSPDLQRQKQHKLNSWETSSSKETPSAIGNSSTPTPTSTASVFVTKTGGSTPESQKERSISPTSSHISAIIKQNTMNATPVAKDPHRQFTWAPTSPARSVLKKTNSSIIQDGRAIPSIATTSHFYRHSQYPQHHDSNSYNGKNIRASNQTLRQSTSSLAKTKFTTATKTLPSPPSPPSFSSTASSLPFFRQQPELFSSEHADNHLTHAPISNIMNSDNRNKQQHLGNHYRSFQQQQQLIDSHGLFNNSSLSVSGWKLTHPSTIMPNGRFSPSANISDFVAMRKLTKKEKTSTHHHPSLSSTSTAVQGQQQHHLQENKEIRNTMPFCELRRLHDNLNEKHHFE